MTNTGTNTNAEVARWLSEAKAPLVDVIKRVHDVIVGADDRIVPYIKYNTLQFAFEGDLCAFVQVNDASRASLMFNRGAKIPGTFRYLEGDGATARFMRFASAADVDKQAAELATITRAWCGMMSASSGSTAKPSGKNTKPSAKNAKPSAKNAKPSAKNAKPSAKNAKPSAKKAKPRGRRA